MTEAENEIVADAGLRLAELAGRCAIDPANLTDALWRSVSADVNRIRGLLSALPLEAEGV